MSGGQQGGFAVPDQKPVSSDREDTLQLPPWQDQGGGMEGSDSYRNPGFVGFRGGGVQGYGTPNHGVGGFAGGGYGGGVLGAGQAGISGVGVGGGFGAGGGYPAGGGFQAGGGGGGGLQVGGFGGPSSRIFTSPGRSDFQIGINYRMKYQLMAGLATKNSH